MAEAKTKQRYFKLTKHAGLKFLVKDGGEDPTQNEYVRAVMRREKYQGDTRYVGFIATDDSKIQKRLEAKQGAEEIEKKEYDKAIKGA